MNYSPKISSIDIIKKYNLKPHFEGGYYKFLYEDTQIIPESSLPAGYKGARQLWNGILYLLPCDAKTTIHRIRMTELWNFHLGCPLELYDISPKGELIKKIIGQELLNDNEPAYVFPRQHWIAAKPHPNSVYNFSLVSCITSPGFTFLDWEKGDREFLINQYPHLQEIITTFTD